MQMSPRLLQYLDAMGWGEGRLPPPEPLVGAEHFVGSAPERRVFSFYGETFELPHDISTIRAILSAEPQLPFDAQIAITVET